MRRRAGMSMQTNGTRVGSEIVRPVLRPDTGAWTERVAAASALLSAIAVVLMLVPVAAQGARGDAFGIADVNVVGADTAPAFPGTKAFWAGTCDLHGESTSQGGVGAAPSHPFTHCIDMGEPLSGGFSLLNWATPPSWRIDPVSQAGAHPDATTSFWFRRQGDFPSPTPDGEVRRILAKLPPGVVGNPNAVPKCSPIDAQVIPAECPPETQVGAATIAFPAGNDVVVEAFPVYNVEPRAGKVAELLIGGVGFGSLDDIVNIPIVAKVRTAGDFGIDALVAEIPNGIPTLGQALTLWGVPWASSHDVYRSPRGFCATGMPATGLDGSGSGSGCRAAIPQAYDESWGPIKPFFTNPTECAPTVPVTSLDVSSWQRPDEVESYDAPADAVVSGCDDPPFQPDIEIEPTTTVADGPTGLKVELTLPQNNDPPVGVATDPDDDTGAPAYWKSAGGLATAHLDRAVVTLPAGVSVNPSASAGLLGCSDQQLALGTDAAVTCPDGAKIGTVAVETPLLDETLSGEMWLREPRSTDPTSGEMFRMAIVVTNAPRGLTVKLPGSAVADPSTGRLTATFDENPQIPFSKLTLQIKGGPRGILAMPQRCGAPSWTSVLSPWSAEHGGGGQPADAAGAFAVSSGCGFGFAPTLRAGMDSSTGGGGGTFSLRFSRTDGQQWFRGVTAQLPTGLLASVRDVPLCTNAQAAANACPAASRIGAVDAAAGSGDPFVLEKKGTAYLTEGYMGAPYGMSIVVPVEAGPFRGQYALDPIVVRQALHVDRTSARVTAVSDPLPTIWHGIPLRARDVTVRIDRLGFMRNPTDCSAKQVGVELASAAGTRADRSSHFQATGCARLAFEPKIAMRLTGKRQTRSGGHPGVRAMVTQRSGEAGIARAEVRLPRSLALDPANAQALCEFVDGTKPDLENHCPQGSIVGHARAVSPLLNRPLEGPVYFVKNVRIDPTTGNPIRTLPMLIAALRGEIEINLRSQSNVKGDHLVSTFENVPDAPISRFGLNVDGGRNGILVVTGSKLSICGRQIAEADVDGHNGRMADQDVLVKTPCSKRRPVRLKIRRSTWRDERVAVVGSVAPEAGGRIGVTVRCGKASATKRVRPRRSGRWSASLSLARCAGARQPRVTATYRGSSRFAAAVARRAIAAPG